MHVFVPAGTPALWLGEHSRYPAQREMLLPPGRYVSLDKVFPTNGRLVTQCVIR